MSPVVPDGISTRYQGNTYQSISYVAERASNRQPGWYRRSFKAFVPVMQRSITVRTKAFLFIPQHMTSAGQDQKRSARP